MIESITIKSVASFNDVGIQINDLKKVNFFYGANASGKTTISNFLQNTDDEKFKNKGCSIKRAGTKVQFIRLIRKED